MFGGGIKNGEFAHFLTKTAPAWSTLIRQKGSPTAVVDIGVYDGAEAALAVRSGYTVFAFEPINEHIYKIQKTFAKRKLSNRIKFVNLTAMVLDDFEGDIQRLQQFVTKERMLEDYPLIEVTEEGDHGFCYLFQAAASNEYKKETMRGAGVWSSIGGAAPRSNRGPSSTVIEVPVSDFIHHDIFWFKADVQGYELSVLRGAVKLFQSHSVQAMTIEYWPIVIENNYGEDGTKKLLELIEQELGLRVCFPSMPTKTEMLFDRAVGITEFVEISRKVQRGFFAGHDVMDDLTCF